MQHRNLGPGVLCGRCLQGFIFWSIYCLMFLLHTLKRSWCWSRRCIGPQHSTEPWPQRTMEEWPQRTMTAKKDECKKTMTSIDCNKTMTAKHSHCKEQFWKEVSNECFVFTTSTCSVWRKSGTRASYWKTSARRFWRKMTEIWHESVIFQLAGS